MSWVANGQMAIQDRRLGENVQRVFTVIDLGFITRSNAEYEMNRAKKWI